MITTWKLTKSEILVSKYVRLFFLITGLVEVLKVPQLCGRCDHNNIQNSESFRMKLIDISPNDFYFKFNFLLWRSIKDIPKSVEDRMRELATQFNLDYDAMCTNDNTNCAW